MPRASNPEPLMPLLASLLDTGDGAPTIEQKLELAHSIRTTMRDGGRQLDQILLEHIVRTGSGLQAAQAAQQELRALLERLASPPWYPALFLRVVDTELGTRAMVLQGGTRRVVAVAEDVDLDDLAVGEEVFLGSEGTVVAGRSPYGTPQHGETAFFERLTPDGRCVLRWRDEEVVVEPAGSLDVPGLVTGDQVRWERTAWMAFEKLDAAAQRRFLLDYVADIGPEQVGGQDANVEAVLSALTAAFLDPAKAAAYGLPRRRSILMVGPSGCGKTLITRVATAGVARASGRPCKLAVVKPAEWESPWVGETQQNIRNCFKALREAMDGPAVLFLDEVESVGRIRGGSGGIHSDKFLAALLAEIDGFTDRDDIAIIAATNRKDLVDPALLERLSDVEVAIGRPDMRGARAIFDIHLPVTIPMQVTGGAAADVREDIIDTAVSRLYSPNADNDLCTLRFRDGKIRVVAARELASGRLFAQVCRSACHRAFLRDLRGGESGLSVADMEHAVAEAIARLATTLRPLNVHSHLADLPEDVDVVSVDPMPRRVARASRYRHAA